MSGIGGIMDIEKYDVDVDRLNRMRMSLSLRGRKRSTAFVGGNVGMFFNSSSPDAFSDREDRQPNIIQRRGYSYALCIDGEGFDSSSILEKYLVHGVEFLGMLEGRFALSLYDGERNMLILARDRKGRRPLFYKKDKKSILFSSEVKGILGATEGYVGIDRDILSVHITSPMGIYSAADIYTDVREVMPGECVLFTRMGMSRFFYREARDSKKIRSKSNAKSNVIIELCTDVDMEKLGDCLSEMLIAFDYPQFDCYMPSLCRTLADAERGNIKELFFADSVRRKNISYAYEREDRLGSLYGINCMGVLPKQDYKNIENQMDIRTELYNCFCSMEAPSYSFLSSVMREARFDSIRRELEATQRKKEYAEESIRVLGMLLQTVEWSEANRLAIKSENKILCYDYF